MDDIGMTLLTSKKLLNQLSQHFGYKHKALKVESLNITFPHIPNAIPCSTLLSG